MKKLTIVISLLLGLSSFAQSEENLKIYTGHINGPYYKTGQELCEILGCSVKNSNGSIENIDEVNNQIDYKIGIVQSDILHDAYYGVGPFEGYKFKNIRTLCALYEEAYTIVVKADSDIKNFKDLKKKTVNVGKLNSGNYHAAKKLLKLYDMQLSDFKHIGHLSVDSQGEALCKGTIDAAIYSISHPNKLIYDLAKKCNVRILTIDDKIIEEHINKEPYYIYTIIKANSYYGNKKEIKTMGTIATLVASTNLPDKYTCNIIEKINKQKHNLKLIHPSLHDINIHTMVPLHPGALEFYSKTNKK